jgi:hypothetical protein
MFMSLTSPAYRTQHNHFMKETNKSCENVEEFKYLGMTVTHENCIHG